MRRGIGRVARSALRNQRGIAAVEFGLLGTIMVTVLLSAYDLGNAAQQQILLQESVGAGAQYAVDFPTDTAGITGSVKSALPLGWTNVTIAAPVTSCACWSAISGTSASSTCSCPTGSTLQRFISLSVSRPYSPMLFTSLNTLSASYVARYQ